MADVIITPASGLIDFQNTSGISSATSQLDGNGNLSISAAAGDIEIGDTASDIFVGDGVANVDIVFEEDGEIRGLTGKTITFGQSDSYLAFAGDVTGDVTFSGKIVFPDNATVPDNPTNEQYDYMTFGANGSISQVSGRGALMIASSDDSLVLSNGDVGRNFTNSNIDVDPEHTYLLTDGGVYFKTNLQNGWGNEKTFYFDANGQGNFESLDLSSTGTALVVDGGMTVAGVATFSGAVTILGNLQVDGTQTIINSTTLSVDDLNITLADGAANASAANGAGITVDGASATLTYASTGDKWVFNKSLDVTGNVTADGLRLGDSDYAYFGDSNDLQIYHDGSNSSIVDTGTGNLLIWGNAGIFFQSYGSGDYFAKFNSDAAVELYYDNAKKFETASGGVSVTGVIDLTSELNFTDPNHKYVDFYTKNSGGTAYSATLRLVNHDSTSFHSAVKMIRDGAVELYHSGTKKFETTGAGVTVTGIATAATFYAEGGTYAAGTDTVTDAAFIVEEEGSIYTRDGAYLRNLIQKKSDVIIIGQQNTSLIDEINLKPGGAGAKVKLHAGETGDNVKLQTVSDGIQIAGIVTAISGIVTYYGDGQYLEGVSASGGSGDGSDFNTGLTTTAYASASDDIDGFTAIGVTFPTTADKRYLVTSMHITNVSPSDLYLTSRIDYNGGENVPLTNKVIVPYQGSLEIIDESFITNPSDNLRFAAFTGIGTTAGGVTNGLDCWVTYETKDDTNYIGIGSTVPTTGNHTVFTSNTNPSTINTINLTNYSNFVDVDASVSIYRGGTIRQGYLAYNLTIPQNSSVQILPRSKRLNASDTIVVNAGIGSAISVNIAGKYIT